MAYFYCRAALAALTAALLLGACTTPLPAGLPAGLMVDSATSLADGLDTRPVARGDSGSTLAEGWQHGAFMEIFVRGYADSDGDGIGDLRGLTAKLDYLQALGISGLWLMPITASADHDHGYAATDFRRIEPAYGSLADFDELLRQAHARGIGVVIDYMVNHSAAASPLFQASAAGRSGPWRDWYVWQDSDSPLIAGWDIWGLNPWHALGGASYFATFGADMPDFNLRHPPALAYHLDSLRFWLNRGLDGFRLDAVPHLIENNAKDWNDQPESRALTRQLRRLVQGYERRHVVCEATAEPKAYARDDLCGSAFAFGLENQLVRAARGEPAAVAQVARYFDDAPGTMGVFVSNHDQFAGRRLWDQVGGDLAVYRLTAATYLLLPGTPYLYYGEEIGQAGATALTGDPEIRAPMSWTADAETAGFTTGRPFRPLARNAAQHNAAAQAADPQSLLAHYKTLLALRKALPSIARGDWQHAVADGATLSVQRRLGDETTLLTYNYGRAPARLAVAGLPPGARLVAAHPAAATPLAAAADGSLQVPLAGQSFAVWRVLAAGTAPSSAAPAAAPAAPPACSPAALGDTTLYLRGGISNWTADDALAFSYRCDAYYLNVALAGLQRFKIADQAWSDATIYGNAPGAASAGGLPALLARGPATTDLVLTFDGAQTLRLAFAAGQPTLALLPGHFDDARQRPITDPVALSLRHDSRDLADKQPFGAVPAGTELRWALTALPGVSRATLVIERRHQEGNQTVLNYQPLLRLPMQREAVPANASTTASAAATTTVSTERFTARHRIDALGVYGYWFEVQIGGQTYVLQNNDTAIAWTREKGSNGRAQVAWLPAALRQVRRLRLTVFDAQFKVPDWAADAVYYCIFPERFRNGDRRNDPRPGQARYQDQTIEQHPRWLQAPYKPGSGDGSDAVYNNDFFGGDLAGIIDKLDYIRDLGANAIYLTPVFRAASNHKYDTADYRQIDPGFGSNADFSRLTQAAAARGIRVIPDASFNHTGSDSLYFDRFGNFASGADGRPNLGAFANGRVQPSSPYASWYRFKPGASAADLPYTGWSGVADLPELDKNAPAWRDFAYRAPGSITRLWLQRGAAGWRMDVAPWVPDDFWREWRSVVKQTDAQAITIAETWFEASQHLLGDTFDSTMNYVFRNAVLDYAAGGKAQHTVQQLELLRELYPPQAWHAVMNLLSSHDQPRALHVLGDTRISAGAASAAPSAAAVALARQRLRLALFFQMTYPGAPAVYYGDEVGLTGGDDPYNRAPYPWADEGGVPDTALLAEVRWLVRLRHDHAVLRRGTLLAPLHVDDEVIVLARRLGDTAGAGASWALTATNNGDAARTVTVALPAGLQTGRQPGWQTARFTDALTGATVLAADGKITLAVPARYGTLLLGE